MIQHEAGRVRLRTWLRFNAVSAIGVGVQAGALAVFLDLIKVPQLWAAGLAVETAVLHNFAWHWNWTWKHRHTDERESGLWRALVKFHLANGVVSVAGNVAGMWLFAGRFGWPPQVANLVSIAACYLLNYLLADWLVFTRAGELPPCDANNATNAAAK